RASMACSNDFTVEVPASAAPALLESAINAAAEATQSTSRTRRDILKAIRFSLVDRTSRFEEARARGVGFGSLLPGG
ncbi:MAG: hypothetical protein KGL75_10500, partial [Acidobacteriota bacterium]|nr:hypothetical protein [Acidobacteriota bacterium]